MYARTLVAATVAVGLAASSGAEAAAVTISATGTGSVRVVPTDRHSNASIAAAEQAAEIASVPLALAAGKAEAQLYATAAGLTLGPLESISDQVNNGPFYFGSRAIPGPFGPGKFCGTTRVVIGHPQPRVTIVGGQKVIQPPKKLRFRKVHRCFVPSPATTTLVVTYSAS